MNLGNYTHPPLPRRRPQGRNPRARRPRVQVYPIGRFFLAYVLALAVSWAGHWWVLSQQVQPVWLNYILIHLAAGLALNKYVFPRVAWNQNFTTLTVVAKAKVAFLIFWPMSYAILIVQLLIARYL